LNLRWKNKVLILVFSYLFIFNIIILSTDNIYNVKEVVNNINELEGYKIKIRGEAIGDILDRKNGYGWVNINNNGSAIGVWASMDELNKIKNLGKYNQKGDILVVTGVANKTCDMHDGELDFHAVDVQIEKEGIKRNDVVDSKLFFIFRLLVLPTIIILGVVLIEDKKKVNNIAK